jgi:hypothetical protein
VSGARLRSERAGLDRSEAGAEASRAKAQKDLPAGPRGETHASNGWPWMATPGLRAARNTTPSVEEHPKGDLEQRER